MVTTIRQGVFETNSSSTHSITITNKNEIKNIPKLIEDNVLYCDNLVYYNNEFGEDIIILTCNSTVEKLALLIHWIYSYQELEEFSDEELDKMVNKVREKANLNKIIITSSRYCHYDDNDNNIFDEYNLEELLDLCFDNETQFLDTVIPR